MADVEVHQEVSLPEPNSEWCLSFQWCTYHYEEQREDQTGYRFIWRRPDGSLQPARGQARIPSAAALLELLSLASKAGWFARVE